MKNFILFAVVIVIAGGAGFGLQRYLQHDEHQLSAEVPKASKINVIGTTLPAFKLTDTEGNTVDTDKLKGKVLLVNFWATWCPPCKKEMPGFIELQDQYAQQGFQIVGIALDDEDSVRDFADTLGVNYPVMAAEYDGIALSREYGNHIGALPYSVFVDRRGTIIATKAGELTKSQVEKAIQPLLSAQ